MNKLLKFFYITFILLNLYPLKILAEEKLKIGLLVPMTGDDKQLGKQIIKSTRIALEDINTENLEIFLKDTNSNPKTTVKSALELKELGVKIVIGPVFYKNLIYLDEIEDVIFYPLQYDNRYSKKCYK